MDQPRWLELAWADLGVAEAPGADNNSKVLRYYADAGHPEVRADEVAWCAAFVGACLERAGVGGTRSLMARSYLAWGEPLSEPRAGAIAVLSRGSDPSLGHVGFLVGLTPSQAVLLGGNQGDAVSVAAFPRAHLLGLRWPATAVTTDGAPAPIRNPVIDSTFERALAHVLEIEGGYSEDPYDPGGPTNHGITLSELARDKGVELTSDNFADLKAELRAIPSATVRRIYRDSYWQAACCPELPPPLALFHFDAAVNQGVAGAARMLQEAVGAEIDGEIGPLTLAAVAARPVEETLAAYADIRRRRYRALPTFWRFGKGWLNRVGSTLALAQEIARAMPPLVPPHHTQPKGSRPMSTDTDLAAQTQPPQGKWWGHSMTIWGVMITALSTVLPVLAPAIGLDLTPELVRQLGDNVLNVGQAVGGLVGTVLAIYGRVRTSTPIERRQFTISM
ncbi:MAG TPA: TIGR02594 family protein [Hyphomicrobiaceae bacterium]|nr:TIGR02594 family protein [Hyphomicrobiaceae bacterium]